ncbi:MAG TPA: alpha/beta hydrolase [Bacteroidales bacterium]|jgi:acetyl esterase/lipase|nr:alpha/beta hydrolase [Bacteroidales bacterium]HBZ20938.1 alpha/beta hydrolase [Bacteroidales bacterium]
MTDSGKSTITGKVLKYLLKCFLLLIVVSIMVVIAPRIWSALNPDKPPVGYHFMAPAYVALWFGLEKLVNTTPTVPSDIEEIKNIEYKNIDGKSLQLDLYKPVNLKDPAPLLVFIHGGGWKSGKRSDYLIYLVDFAKRGYATATVSYRLLNDGPYPACAEDIKDAVGWFFRNGEKYGYDPDRIALVGGSAGGHLSMLGGYGWGKTNEISDSLNHKIKAVVDIYGPADLTTGYARNHTLVTSFLARSYKEAPALYEEASPVHYLDKDDPPTLILHGTSDRLVPVSQSDNLKSALDSLGVPCVYYRFPLWPHTMDIVKRVNDFCQEKMQEFFDEYLK